MRQVPPPGWGDETSNVRVSFLGAESARGLSARTAARAIQLAQAAVQRAAGEPGTVVQLQSTAEIEKEVPCVPTDCLLVRFNVGLRGATIGVDLSRGERVSEVGWSATPFGPEPLHDDKEIIEHAASDPGLIAAVAGRPFRAYVLSYGAKNGPPCEVRGISRLYHGRGVRQG